MAEAVKDPGTPQVPSGGRDLRLFGGGGTEHYSLHVPVPPFETILAAALHRLHVAAMPFVALSRGDRP